MKNAIESTGNRADQMEERIKDGNAEIIQLEEERDLRHFKSEETLQDLLALIRKANIISTSEEEEREKRIESIFEKQTWGKTWS